MRIPLNVFNKIFICYILLKPTLSGLGIFTFDGRGRIVILLAFIVLLANIRSRRFWEIFKVSSVKLWFLWSLYVSVAWILIGLRDVGLDPQIFLFAYVVTPFIALLLSVYESKRDCNGFARFLYICFSIDVLLGLLFQGITPSSGERGGEMLGNALPLDATCYLAIASFSYIKGWLKGKSFIFTICLTTIAILMVATRKAFVSELIILAFVVLARFNMRKPRNIFIVLVLFLAAYFSNNLILENTVLGERMGEIEESGEQFNTSDIKILNILGDRVYFYITGWNLFLQNPIFGIGLFNFREVTGCELPIHSEYIVQLCETGVIGTILFILYIISLFSAVNRIKSFNFKKEALISYGCIAAWLFIGLTAWTYQFPRNFFVMGLIIGYSEFIRQNHLKS